MTGDLQTVVEDERDVLHTVLRLVEPTTRSVEIARGIIVLILGHDDERDDEPMARLIGAILETRYGVRGKGE